MFSTRSHLARLRRRSLLFPLLLSFVFVLLVGMFSPAAVQQSTEILWDTYGVPHIFGRIRLASPMLLVGQMQSHGNLLLRLYGQAWTRAEYWGRNTWNQISANYGYPRALRNGIRRRVQLFAAI